MNPEANINEGTHMMVNNIEEQNMLLSYLKPDMRVLEFGLGYSTRLIAAKVREVVSIEHDHENFKHFKETFGSLQNVTPIYVAPNAEIQPDYDDGTYEQFSDYVRTPQMLVKDEKFDVVFVDGRARVACAEYAAKEYLKEGGVIFIHDYRHPNHVYRRQYLEVVERFLKMEKHVFAMAMFTVRSAGEVEQVLTEQDPTGFGSAIQKILNDQIREMGGVPWYEITPDGEHKELTGQHTVIGNHASLDSEAGGGGMLITSNEVFDREKEKTNPQNAMFSFDTRTIDPANIIKMQEVTDGQVRDIKIQTDKSTCWYDPAAPAEMNRFYDQHIKTHDITKHMEPFTKLLNCIVADSDHHLLDLGCGTAMLADWVPGFEYYGADLPHIIAGSALRNHPFHFYRGCDIVEEDLSWIEYFDVIAMSGVIDIMDKPIEVLKKVLHHTKKYMLIHRQEISDSNPTHVGSGPGYGGPAFHSIINRNDFNEIVQQYGFRIVAEVPCSFTNWENGGSSFLLAKQLKT